MTQRTVSAHSVNLPLLLVLGTTAVMLAVRLAEAPGNPLVYMRLAFSIAALGVVFVGRAHLLRSAVLALALEAAGAALTFAYLDLPFVNAHQTQIGALALDIAERLQASPATQR